MKGLSSRRFRKERPYKLARHNIHTTDNNNTTEHLPQTSPVTHSLHAQSHFIFITTSFDTDGESESQRLSPRLTHYRVAELNPNSSLLSTRPLLLLPPPLLSVKVLGSFLSMCLRIFCSYNKIFSSPTLLKTRQKQITEV